MRYFENFGYEFSSWFFKPVFKLVFFFFALCRLPPSVTVSSPVRASSRARARAPLQSVCAASARQLESPDSVMYTAKDLEAAAAAGDEAAAARALSGGAVPALSADGRSIPALDLAAKNFHDTIFTKILDAAHAAGLLDVHVLHSAYTTVADAYNAELNYRFANNLDIASMEWNDVGRRYATIQLAIRCKDDRFSGRLHAALDALERTPPQRQQQVQ